MPRPDQADPHHRQTATAALAYVRGPHLRKCPFRAAAIRGRASGHTLPRGAAPAPERPQMILLTGLLRGTGILCRAALSTVGAEDGYLHAPVLLAIAARFFVVHRLVFAQTH